MQVTFCTGPLSKQKFQAPILHSPLSYDYHHAFDSTGLKVNGYTFRGRNSVIFIVASQLNCSHFMKERICSYQSKFIPLRVNPILERLSPPDKQTGSHENYLPLKTWKKKKVCVVPIHRKQYITIDLFFFSRHKPIT